MSSQKSSDSYAWQKLEELHYTQSYQLYPVFASRDGQQQTGLAQHVWF